MRANLRRMVWRVLRKYGYPPDKQEKATLTVLEQAEQIAKDWAGEADSSQIALHAGEINQYRPMFFSERLGGRREADAAK